MAKDTNFFDLLERRIKLSLHTFAPAKVISYDEANKTADVELLFMTRDSQDNLESYPLIQGAPVLKHVGVLYAGNVVFVAFAERALDNLNGNVKFDPGYLRTHDIRDGVVLGVFE